MLYCFIGAQKFTELILGIYYRCFLSVLSGLRNYSKTLPGRKTGNTAGNSGIEPTWIQSTHTIMTKFIQISIIFTINLMNNSFYISTCSL